MQWPRLVPEPVFQDAISSEPLTAPTSSASLYRAADGDGRKEDGELGGKHPPRAGWVVLTESPPATTPFVCRINSWRRCVRRAQDETAAT